MADLYVAVSAQSRVSVEKLLDEQTVGRWRRWVTIVTLGPYKTAENDAEVNDLAGQSTNPIYVLRNLVSNWVAERHSHVVRLTKDHLLRDLSTWLDRNELTWSSRAAALKDLSGFEVCKDGQNIWRGQFKRVDSRIGPKVAKALLAQLRIVRVAPLVESMIGNVQYDYNVYFTGNDPHSGDFSMVGPLAARIPGANLFEANKLPILKDGATVRLFSDGAWSGGETAKRVQCLTSQCEHKQNFVGPTHTLNVSIGYMTTEARSRMATLEQKLLKKGAVRALEVTCPASNILDPTIGGRGLAFADDDVNAYVDPDNPKAFFDFCRKVGTMMAPNRPLGTNDIASTIGFEHSLPKAMLPLLIAEGTVTAEDGSDFHWEPLLRSRHVDSPARNDPDFHCTSCKLRAKPPVSAMPTSDHIADPANVTPPV